MTREGASFRRGARRTPRGTPSSWSRRPGRADRGSSTRSVPRPTSSGPSRVAVQRHGGSVRKPVKRERRPGQQGGRTPPTRRPRPPRARRACRRRSAGCHGSCQACGQQFAKKPAMAKKASASLKAAKKADGKEGAGQEGCLPRRRQPRSGRRLKKAPATVPPQPRPLRPQPRRQLLLSAGSTPTPRRTDHQVGLIDSGRRAGGAPEEVRTALVALTVPHPGGPRWGHGRSGSSSTT